MGDGWTSCERMGEVVDPTTLTLLCSSGDAGTELVVDIFCIVTSRANGERGGPVLDSIGV